MIGINFRPTLCRKGDSLYEWKFLEQGIKKQTINQSINQSINQFINQSLNSGFQYSSTWIHIGCKKFRGISYSRIDHELQIRVHMTPQINMYSMWTYLNMPAKLLQHFFFLNSNRCSLIWPLSVLLVCDSDIKSKRKCKEK